MRPDQNAESSNFSDAHTVVMIDDISFLRNIAVSRSTFADSVVLCVIIYRIHRLKLAVLFGVPRSKYASPNISVKLSR